MHPILEIAIGVALGMTVFIVIAWVIGMCVYVACSKNDCIASTRKIKKFKSNSNQTVYTPDLSLTPIKEESPDLSESKAIKETETS
jgi:hypothetical protein